MSKQTALLEFIVRHADNNLILGHRLSEWCSRGPFLEEDIATTNIALDNIGQARLLYTYAGEVEGKARTEDDFAYWRTHEQFTNAIITELPNGDFAVTTARQLFFSAYAYVLNEALQKSADATLAAYATKALKETQYHLRHCSEWVVRLGDGTEESKRRMQSAIDELWPYTNDLFAVTSNDKTLIEDGTIPDLKSLKGKWTEIVTEVITRATLIMPDLNAFQHEGSRVGKHTEHLSYLIGEMQSVTRAYPGAKW